ncbi:hypothetical protein FRUB_05561 [Fimbriiglobus ruber]|uniref:Transglutaminase-like domain-containing protein n=1 Tax=Fimbriiglobus ruber TaxID=1908690 RepID=A0A225DDP7_9BACT|nr:hypothetical protein FRUB_05561 [Fimbriiglobus ruber]
MTLIVLAAATAGPAQTSPILKLKENNQLHANGDCTFQYEVQLPVAMYTTFKRNTPNTAVFIRKFVLSDQNVVLDGQTGEWVDADSTLKIRFNARGIARVTKGGAWEIPLIDSIDTELVAVAENTAILTQAAEISGLGLATNTIRVAMPAGTTDVKILKSPTRLTYHLPAPTAADGEAKVDIELEAKDQVMTSLAKALSNKAFGPLWTARSKFKNMGTVALHDYRIRFRIPEYAPTWSSWQGTPLVVAGQTVLDGYYPIFEMEKIGRLTGQTKAALEIQYQYKGPDGKLVEETETKELILLSRNQVYYTSLKSSECVDWADRDNLGAVVLSSFVTHEDPVIQQAAGRIAKWSGGANAAGSDDEAIKFMAAVYLFMAENIAYQTPPFGQNEAKFIQHVKYGRDVLKNKAGTCIDLAILYGSLCEAVGLEPVLYNIPGHTFPAVRLPDSKKVLAVEATLIGRGSFQDAVKTAEETNMKAMRAGNKSFTEVMVSKLHKAGAVPMDLPNVGEDPLEKWGIKMPNPLAVQNQNQNADVVKNDGNPAPRRAVDPIVGTWTAVFNANGLKVVGVAMFKEGGAFEGAWVFGDGVGRRVSSDTGSWSVNGNNLTIKGDNSGTVVRRFEAKGDEVKMELKEFGLVVTFTRKK